MKNGYEKKSLCHNIEKFNLIVRNDINMFSFTQILIGANKNTALQVNFISGAKSLTKVFK